MLDFVNIEQQAGGIVPFGTDFENPDFGQVAIALGAHGIRLEEPGDPREALRAALSHTEGPVVLDVVVDRYALVLPSHVPAQTAEGFTLGSTTGTGSACLNRGHGRARAGGTG